MADVLLICVREEDKDDFVVEFIKGLMSRGLTVSYAGAFYSERKDHYTYDNVTNLLFFASTYFREAKMKSEDFQTWEGFLENIDFEQTDARLVIFSIICKQKIDFDILKKRFLFFLERNWSQMATTLIRSSFEMDFSSFESYYPDIVQIFGFNEKLLKEAKKRAIDREIGRGIGEERKGIFDRFIGKCRKLIDKRQEIARKKEYLIGKQQEKARKEKYLQELKELQEIESSQDEVEQLQEKLEQLSEEIRPIKEEIGQLQEEVDYLREEVRELQKKLEQECLRDPLMSRELIVDFLDTDIIDRAARNPERAIFFEISRRIPEKRILCLYYEERFDEKEHEREKIDLCFYPKPGGEAINFYFSPEGLSEEQKSIRELPQIPRCSLGGLKSPRDLYEPKNIGKIIDEHVMLALHPSLIDIHFPTNGFMLEVDPEEPEIGFLSTEVFLENCQTREEALRVNTKLRKKIKFYKYKEKKGKKSGRFAELEIRDKKEEKEEKLLIIGRIEDLYKTLMADKWYGRVYQPIHTILKLLVLFATTYLFLNILRTYLSEATDRMTIITLVSVFLLPIVVLCGAIFAFWALRTFALDYLLDPMYWILRMSTYFILALILSFSMESMMVNVILLFLVFFCGVFLFTSYICSAAYYELNISFGIADQCDSLYIEGLDAQYDNEYAKVLRCGRFKTVVRKNSTVISLLNSDFFPRIKWIYKRVGTIPRKMAYSSGVFLSPENEEPVKDREKKPVEELIYRKPRKWGFWGAVRNLFFGKGEIESSTGSDSKPSSSDRFIYFGQWKYVMKHIGSAIPVFPQSVLFRNMIILAAFSGFIFNIFVTYAAKSPTAEATSAPIGFWNIMKYLVIPALCIIITRRFRFRFWRVVLVVVFIYLLSMQPYYIIVLAVLIFLVVLFLLWFPIEQALYSIRIWVNERRRGNIVSVINRKDDLRGIRIQTDLLVTRLVMNRPGCIEEKRIYFNKRFFNDIVMSYEWEKLREN